MKKFKKLIALLTILSFSLNVVPSLAITQTYVSKVQFDGIEFTYTKPDERDPFIEGEQFSDDKIGLVIYWTKYWSDGYKEKMSTKVSDRSSVIYDKAYHLKPSDKSFQVIIKADTYTKEVWIPDDSEDGGHYEEQTIYSWCRYIDSYEDKDGKYQEVVFPELQPSYTLNIPIKVVSKNAPLKEKYPVGHITGVKVTKGKRYREYYSKKVGKKWKCKKRWLYPATISWKYSGSPETNHYFAIKNNDYISSPYTVSYKKHGTYKFRIRPYRKIWYGDDWKTVCGDWKTIKVKV